MSQLEDNNYNIDKDQGEAIKREIRRYTHYWYWFVLGIIVALIGAFIYLRYTPKVYNASAKIKILNKTKGLELPSSAFVFNRSNINLENEIEILKSYRIIENVVDRLDLTMRFYEEGNVLTTEIYRLPFNITKTVSNDSIYVGSSYRIVVKPNAFEVTPSSTSKVLNFPNFDTTKSNHNLPFELSLKSKNTIGAVVGKSYIVSLSSISAITNGLKNRIEVGVLGANSDLLKLDFKSQSKSKNERVLNTLIDVFNEDGINDRQEVSRRTIDFIDERFTKLARELDSIEVDIKDYKQKNNLITLDSDAELGISQRTISEQELFEVERELMLSDLLKESIEKPEDKSGLLPANIGLDNSSINGLLDNYNTLVFERENLLKTSAGENNPNVVLLESKLKDVKSNIFASIDSYSKQLEASKAQIARKNRKFSSQVYSLPAKEKAIVDITRQREIKQSLYLFLLQKREEAAINLAITEPSIKVVEYAISNGAPISPNTRSIYLMALLAGLIVPFGVLYVIQLLNTKVKDREDVQERNPKIPIVGELPKVKSDQLIFKNPEDNSVQAEAFRILSSNVDYILPVKEKGTGRVIFCTSTIKGEGKTYVSINLSLSLSSINRKVLLIGADLRNPQIHTHISEEKHKPGLSNYLHDVNYNWRDAIIKGFEKHPNHDIILSGSIPPNPAHLLTNGRFEKLLEEASKEYDYVVVDTAPTILVTDTMLISKLADATIYLVRANYTEKNLLNYSKELNESGKLKNIAYVLNSVDTNKSYGYGYNYGYNYGYGTKE
ncbi:GumC family protein [Winogradskyella endarachnes]|uniref:non-specific protein-tyrosine kinase n=1 Tax=Winogradskyella endarachnes TaxID=2681965 RepID=A0A6L6UAV0_9FLAO|nr:polysaccharide biosynthesis tyrosine autokinase [Winogradskyella endarachnes]MUU77884.1 polysaccharide biosynthesis tyrosine autokinase [Winogradskyella endarachnes]